MKVSVSCQLIAQTFAFLNLHHLITNGSPTSSKAPFFDIRLLSLSKGAEYFGSMNLFLQEGLVMSTYFVVVFSSYFFLKKGQKLTKAIGANMTRLTYPKRTPKERFKFTEVYKTRIQARHETINGRLSRSIASRMSGGMIQQHSI